MSNFRRFIKSLDIDYGSFNVWADKALNPRTASPHKALFDRYDRSLRAVELAQARLEAWMLANLDEPDFEARLEERRERLEALERASVARLRRIFDAYLADVKADRA
jgi:hypothetical protein